MNIGFDVSQTGRLKAGCGYLAESLIRHLAEIDTENQYILYPTFGDVYCDPEWPAAICRIDRPNFRQGLGHKAFESAQRFWRQPPGNLEEQLGNPDIVHSNNFYCPTTLRSARLVYTLYDLGFIEYPEFTTEENRIGCFTGVFEASLYADFIIAISEYTRWHFLETFPHFPADRIAVVYPASRFGDPTGGKPPRHLSALEPEQYWLNVGTLDPRKNQRRLLAAYARLKQQVGHTFPLVFAGGQGWLMDDFEDTLDELQLRNDVILLGYVDDATLHWLYEHCFAFLYPSLFEGFGLPVLEAMSLGAPVITSSASSIPEIVGPAGLLVNPLEEDDICRAMLSLLHDRTIRDTLKGMARERANAFSWEGAARSVLGIYRELAGVPKRNEAGPSLPASL